MNMKILAAFPLLGLCGIGGPDRDRTDDLFDAIDKKLVFSKTYKVTGAPWAPVTQHRGLLNREVSKKGTAAFGKLSGPALAA
jgi:hypothetical protein